MKQNDPLRVYISGAITGDPQALEKFTKAEAWLRELGFDVVNPLSIPGPIPRSWTDYMRLDIKALLDCDAIVSLDGWQKSRGGRLERMIAGELAFLVFEGVENARFWMELKRDGKVA